MSLDTRQKAHKGTVSVESFRERLRLRWRFEGKQYSIGIGLQDTPVNRKAAKMVAGQIELDIASGHFDRTLKRYKPAQDTQSDTREHPSFANKHLYLVNLSFGKKSQAPIQVRTALA
ncbi:Arm DNA-binding domain-containing protein [Anthocerotibacter panamensis]|uniref:Arm DNA-binding domain-containing protein n=1 Tax=Anthocerotibacter panamensis TaxID=2857077 RepID=UPI001C407D40|nr:DUF3596 domain-containing protein [Anthocerotibacter panamensis]